MPFLYIATGSTTDLSAVAHAWRKKNETAVTMNLIKAPPRIGFIHRFKPRNFGSGKHDHRDVLAGVDLDDREKSFGLLLKIALHLGRGALSATRQTEGKSVSGDG